MIPRILGSVHQELWTMTKCIFHTIILSYLNYPWNITLSVSSLVLVYVCMCAGPCAPEAVSDFVPQVPPTFTYWFRYDIYLLKDMVSQAEKFPSRIGWLTTRHLPVSLPQCWEPLDHTRTSKRKRNMQVVGLTRVLPFLSELFPQTVDIFWKLNTKRIQHSGYSQSRAEY